MEQNRIILSQSRYPQVSIVIIMNKTLNSIVLYGVGGGVGAIRWYGGGY